MTKKEGMDNPPPLYAMFKLYLLETYKFNLEYKCGISFDL